jgi:hypothetical protein
MLCRLTKRVSDLCVRLTNQEFPVLAQKVLEEVRISANLLLLMIIVSLVLPLPCRWLVAQVPEQLLQYMEQHHIKPNKK